MIREYNKIVRDRVPQIIESQGKKCNYISEEDSEISHLPALARKLDEEVKEYHNSIYVDAGVEELTDIVEVCYALADHLGYSVEQFEEMRLKKKEEKGGFDNLYFLYTVED